MSTSADILRTDHAQPSVRHQVFATSGQCGELLRARLLDALQPDVSLSPLEAAAIADGVAAMPEADRERLAGTAHAYLSDAAELHSAVSGRAGDQANHGFVEKAGRMPRHLPQESD